MKNQPNLAILGVGEFWRQNLALLAIFTQSELATLRNFKFFLEMSEPNPKKARFQAKVQVFEEVAQDLKCTSCKIVPRNPPVYQTDKGLVLCAECKPESRLTGIFQSPVIEKLVMKLPVSCKYQKNDCQVVQDRKNIAYHEQDCHHRNVMCPYDQCEEQVSLQRLKRHLLDAHRFNLNENSKNVSKIQGGDGIFSYSKSLYPDQANSSGDWKGLACFEFNSKRFLILSRIYKRRFMVWLQIFGNQVEAKNYRYFLKIQNASDEEFRFNGSVLPIDDSKEDVFKRGSGLSVAIEAIKPIVSQHRFEVEIQIMNLKCDAEDARSGGATKN